LVQEPNGRCLSRGRKRFSRSAQMPINNQPNPRKAANRRRFAPCVLSLEMTMTIEQHIEELRAELQYCPDAEERHQIEAELEAARQELVRRNTDDPPPE
ncbi:hypothetical protein, partial [Ensifer sp. Root127]|uniref:hypothetical protein n=1 Tax=Ensifer sp. Root127 TaxID=1736440 RepID=UPI001AECF5F6